MATLVDALHYRLSSQVESSENKSLIFVKLTDSASRAIEDYLKNKAKTDQQPTIQFLGNEGHLSFPNTSSNGQGAAFNFSLSGNEDIEGLQGSFECLQSKSNSFELMGPLPYKMRIQANDDVYAATKQRMAVAEEQQKKNCTRVIKLYGPEIGRKVKVKKTGAMGAIKREASPPYRSTGHLLNSGIGDAKKPRLNFTQSRSETSSASNNSHLDSHGGSNTSVTSNGPNAQHGRSSSGGRNGANQDIMRRPIRERLIHLLALRPFKKPELYDRIKREGLRERDRASMANMLKQVAYMSDNTYHLIRHMWNDVQEDWPFYSEQDKQILKRRKPQNLTPPGSDGSSGSGHSPTSTHPGSPPPAIFPAAPSPSGTSPANCRLPGPDPSGVKRPGYYDGADGIITKRQRISHFKKQTTEWPPASVPSYTNGSNTQRVRTDPVPRRPPETARSGGSPGHYPPRHQHAAAASSPSPGHGQVGRPTREEGDGIAAPGVPSHSPEAGAALSRNSRENDTESASGRVTETSASPPVKDKNQGIGWSPGKSNTRSTLTSSEEYEKNKERLSSSAAPSSGRGKVTASGAENKEEEASDKASSEFRDYRTEYTKILNAEQRNKYKADFNADYSEYRDLHAIVEMVSRRFAALEERLRQEEMGSEGWNTIKDQIVKEYQENMRDQHFPEAKKKFDYLHAKLSHIKHLVLEYDSSNPGQISSVQPVKH